VGFIVTSPLTLKRGVALSSTCVRVSGFGFRVSDFGNIVFRVSGFGFQEFRFAVFRFWVWKSTAGFDSLGFAVSSTRVRASGVGFRVLGSGFWFLGFGSRFSVFGFRVSGFGSGVSGFGFGFRVSGSGFGNSGLMYEGMMVSGIKSVRFRGSTSTRRWSLV